MNTLSRVIIVVAYVSICGCLRHASGVTQFNKYQTSNGTLAIGATVKVTFEMSGARDGSTIQVYHNVSCDSIANMNCRKEFIYAFYQLWNNSEKDMMSRQNNSEVANLKISYESDSSRPDYARRIILNINPLSKSHNGLNLSAEFSTFIPRSIVNLCVILHVSACKTPTSSVPAKDQDSSIIIETPSNGSYGNSATCNCPNANQTLAYENGTVANATATCGLHANWLGCEMLQCWSGPHNIRSSQTKFTVNAQKPFECSFSPGFPTTAAKEFWVDNMVIGDDYKLKSHHNGKEFWCNVSSRYTDTFSGDFGSTPQQIIVYYPPEKLTLDKFVGIEVNAFKILKYSYFANPKNGDVTTTFQKSEIDYHTPFSWGTDVSNGNQRIRELKVTVTSTDDYGSYNVCSSTTNPQGKDCVDLTISNIMKTTSSEPDTTTSSVTMDDQQPTTSGMPLLTKILIGVALFIFFLSAIPVIYLCRKQQRKKKERAENLKENVLYGTVAGHGTSDNPGGNPHNHITPATDRQEMDEVPYASGPVDASEDFVEYAMATDCVPGPDDVEYASTSADAGVVWNVYTIEEEPGGSRKRPIYAQVKKKKDGRKMPVYAQVKKKRESADDRFRVETRGDDPETSTITYAAIDKSNKKRGKNAAADLYTVVNKPKSKA